MSLLKRRNVGVQIRCLLWRGFQTLPELIGKRNDLVQGFKALPPIRLNDKPVTKSAAVLIALCEDANRRVSLLYTLRSHLMKNHTRQVSFPGKHYFYLFLLRLTFNRFDSYRFRRSA